jgi:serralysin
MASPTAQEQYLLELINRARLHPQAEARRYGIDLNQGLTAGSLNASAKQPLAMDAALLTAARNHSQWMINQDVFSHVGANASSHVQRAQSAGYGSTYVGENIAWVGQTGALNVSEAVHQLHRNLFISAGHRQNILRDQYRQAGTGLVTGQFRSGQEFNAAMTTHAFGTNFNTSAFLTGVSYADANQNGFYDLGEGRGGMTVQAVRQGDGARVSTQSQTAGGYQLQLSAGSYTVTFSGGGLTQAVSQQVTISDQNIKLDLTTGQTLSASTHTTLVANARRLHLLGIAALNGVGNGQNNVLVGNDGNNRLDGMGGNDTLLGGAGRDILTGGAGNDILTGGAGNDTLTGGSGDDQFRFGTGSAYNAGQLGSDLIADFSRVTGNWDKLVLSQLTFAAGTTFASVATDVLAATNTAQITFSTSTGKLFYNQNGSAPGLGQGGQLAILSQINGQAVSASNSLQAGDLRVI